MCAADYFVGFKYLYGPLFIFLMALSFLFNFTAKKYFPVRPSGSLSFMISFGLLAGISGLVAGVSQTPIVSALLTGLLGLISGLIAYLLGKESLIEWRPIVSLSMIFLMLSTLAGLSLGGTYKFHITDPYKNAYAKRLLLYEKVDLEVCKQIRMMRLEGKSVPQEYVEESCPQEEEEVEESCN